MPTDEQRTKWNLMVVNEISKAKTLADKIYWKGMFV